MEKDIPYFEDADSVMKEGLPIVEREAINAIVYNRRTDEILCLDWQKYGWKTFIIGGVEEGEDSVIAAVREITEETGYKNIDLVSVLGRTRSGYYAAHKGENRISNATALLFRLNNEEREEVVNGEDLPHVFVWMPKNKVADFLTPSSQKYIWEKAIAII